MKKQYKDYNPETDTEHLELLHGTLPATRDEQIAFAQALANKTGKRVNINAYSAVPSSPPEPLEPFAVICSVIGGAFLLILLAGAIITVLATITGNLP
jgi:hypothetical protein